MSSVEVVPVVVEQHAVDTWDWPLQHSTVVQVVNTASSFEVCLDVPFFTLKEIEVLNLRLFLCPLW
ncbi:unnamed protein product [Soboliphyme baturini]|uniref:Uncharacterized protein n=1 Tax=Soboliphyme baturini TaxID=241478 RepID=A0A183ITT4_9BILA|nr:unnamed protein product [Soboliphyme baturini]